VNELVGIGGRARLRPHKMRPLTRGLRFPKTLYL
jgi:hypothetical protein